MEGPSADAGVQVAGTVRVSYEAELHVGSHLREKKQKQITSSL